MTGFDLDGYLARVGYVGDRTPTATTLRAVHRAHAHAIPYENLDIHLGRPIRIDEASVAAKLVAGRRGGYCFEQNTLLAAALRALGFEVTVLGADVHMGDRDRSAGPGFPTHMVLRVETDEGPYLADVGFGAAGFLEAVPLAPGEATQGQWQWALTRDGERWLVLLRQPEGWLDLYSFTEEPRTVAECEQWNTFTSTHPDSGFVQRVTVQRGSDDLQLVLRGTELTEFRPSGQRTATVDNPEVLEKILRARFGLDVDLTDLNRSG